MIESLFGTLMLIVGLSGFLVMAWAGVTMCPKCRSWCLGDNDCKERRREKGLR